MYRIEGIPKKLGAHYRSDIFETRELAASFRTEFLCDPEGTYFRVVKIRKSRAKAASAKTQDTAKTAVESPTVESAIVVR